MLGQNQLPQLYYMNNKYTTKNCKHHGETKFVLEGRGYYRCAKCRMDAVSRKRKNLKKDLVEYKGGKCEKCGYNGHTKSWEKLKKEADKCVLVCANCHREIHEQLNGFKDNRKNIISKQYKIVTKESAPSRIKAKKEYNKCDNCHIDTYNKKYCSDKCCKLAKRKVDRPTKEELIQILKINNWTKTARMFGVSDIAVRKWAKQYGINTNRKEL